MKIRMPCGTEIEIDEQDYNYLKPIFPHWRIAGRGKYVIITRYIKTEFSAAVREDVYLARAIVKPSRGFCVDHIDNNPLNNKRSNLRLASPQQNAKNKKKGSGKTSKFNGVSLAAKAKSNPWRIYMRTPDGQKRYFGSFSSETEAAQKYDELALKYWGEFAPLNFPKSDGLSD